MGEAITEVACGSELAPFDSLAAGYDANESTNPILQWMRKRVQALALRVFKPGCRILEIGCGTGTDALFFAQHGFSVVGIDPSPAMLEVAQDKLASRGFAASVDLRLGRAENLDELVDDFGPGSFDAIFSNLGALNCVPRLDQIAGGVNLLLRPGGKMLFTIMPPICPWEIGYHLFKLRPEQAFRRWRGRTGTNGIAVRVGDRKVQTYYHSPASVMAAFARAFEVECQFALGLMVPPPYLQAMSRYPRFLDLLMRCEETVARWPLLRNWGDHFVIVLRKRKLEIPQ